MSEKRAASDQPVKGDDRNLVPADQTASASVEEWLFVFWKKYRTTVIVACVVVVVVIIGRAGWARYQESRENATRSAFAAAETKEQLLAFSREYSGHRLAAVALLNAADAFYADGDYAAAVGNYAEAAAQLADRVLIDRAKLGEGMAAVKNGQAGQGEEILRVLGEDPLAAESIRAEAWYHLASLAHAAGDATKAREAITQVEVVSPTGIWASRAGGLRARLPAESDAPAVSFPVN